MVAATADIILKLENIFKRPTLFILLSSHRIALRIQFIKGVLKAIKRNTFCMMKKGGW